MNLDVLDVIAKIPPEWPLRVLSTFITRSFRRTLHARHEGQIVKAISQGQNLAVSEHAWLILREEGAVVEEPASDDEGQEGEETEEKKLGLELGERVDGQPASFSEKVGLHFAPDAEAEENVVDISVSPQSHSTVGYDVGT